MGEASEMFDVLSAVTLSGLTLSRPPTCANPKTLLGGKLVVCQGSEGNAVKRVTPAMRDPYQYIRSGHYRQILCGASGVPGGIDGSCQHARSEGGARQVCGGQHGSCAVLCGCASLACSNEAIFWS